MVEDKDAVEPALHVCDQGVADAAMVGVCLASDRRTGGSTAMHAEPLQSCNWPFLLLSTARAQRCDWLKLIVRIHCLGPFCRRGRVHGPH